jgi:hypothetical protein
MYQRIFFILLATTTAMASLQSASAQTKTIPQRIDATSRYLFYLHGAILEGTNGHAVSQKFGVYEYEKILAAFVGEGFTVISEVRRKGTPPPLR